MEMKYFALILATVTATACKPADSGTTNRPTKSVNAPGSSSKTSDPAKTDTSKTGNQADDVKTEFRLQYTELHSGFNGRDTYKAPILAYGADKITWTVDKPELVKLEKQSNDKEMMLTMKGAGTANITAKSSDGKTASVKLIITAFTTADYDWGKSRYTTTLAGNSKPCSSCHGAGLDTPDNTPTENDGKNDQVVEATYLTGIDKDTGEAIVTASNEPHKWQVTNPKGMLAYLRALAPHGFKTDED